MRSYTILRVCASIRACVCVCVCVCVFDREWKSECMCVWENNVLFLTNGEHTDAIPVLLCCLRRTNRLFTCPSFSSVCTQSALEAQSCVCLRLSGHVERSRTLVCVCVCVLVLVCVCDCVCLCVAFLKEPLKERGPLD